MSNPKELKYTKDHEWVRLEGSKATIGITDYAQGKLGDVVFVELPAVGDEFALGDAVANIESVKAVSEVYTPVGGRVVEINDELESSPEAVNKDAFGAGWIFVIEIEDPSTVEGLLSAEEYEQLVAEEE